MGQLRPPATLLASWLSRGFLWSLHKPQKRKLGCEGSGFRAHMQNNGEETGWVSSRGGPVPQPHACRRRHRPPRAGAPGTRVAPRGAPACPGGCCRATALRGHPTRYVPAGPAPIGVAVPDAGPLGTLVVPTLPPVPMHPVERDSADAGSSSCLLLANFGQEAFFPHLFVPRFPQHGSWHTCVVARLRGAVSATPCLKRRWHQQPQASPGTRFWGTGTWCSGGGRGQRAPGSWGLPGDVALSLHRGRDMGASRLGNHSSL